MKDNFFFGGELCRDLQIRGKCGCHAVTLNEIGKVEAMEPLSTKLTLGIMQMGYVRYREYEKCRNR